MFIKEEKKKAKNKNKKTKQNKKQNKTKQMGDLIVYSNSLKYSYMVLTPILYHAKSNFSMV